MIPTQAMLAVLHRTRNHPLIARELGNQEAVPQTQAPIATVPARRTEATPADQAEEIPEVEAAVAETDVFVH